MVTTSRDNESNANLFVDIGNSRIKAAFKKNDNWEVKFSIDHSKLQTLLRYLEKNTGIKRIVVSSVVDRITNTLQDSAGGRCRFLTIKDIHSSTIDYQTPETLGIDRYFACLGAWIKSGKKTVIVVDAGTACTVDLMDTEGVYRGGIITPGLGLLEKALHEYAPVLPSARRQLPAAWPGKTTSECIQWGVSGGFIDIMKASIERYQKKYGPSDLWLTGGDAEDVQRLMDIQGRIDRNLVFEGMSALIAGQFSKK